jgi:hypothetical protein
MVLLPVSVSWNMRPSPRPTPEVELPAKDITIGEELASKIVFVCSDMWAPYLKVNGEERIMER